jgi:hypothetical protein
MYFHKNFDLGQAEKNSNLSTINSNFTTFTEFLADFFLFCFAGIPTGDWYTFLYRSMALLFNLLICLVGAGKRVCTERIDLINRPNMPQKMF